MKTLHPPIKPSSNERLLGMLLDAQSSSTAYQRGYGYFDRHRDADPRQAAISVGYAAHTLEHKLFREGFMDALMDSPAEADHVL